jgi:hypothetical protein
MPRSIGPKRATTVGPEGKAPGDRGFVFAAQNVHDPSCGRPLRLQTTADPVLYYGYFENRYGEQFVFTFDRTTRASTVWRGALGCAEPHSFTLDLLVEALRTTQRLAVQITEPGLAEASGLGVIDTALALGRLTGLTGKDEVIWLSPCLAACTPVAGRLEGRRRD